MDTFFGVPPPHTHPHTPKHPARFWTQSMENFFGGPPPPPPHTHTHPARKKEIEEGEMNNEHKASKQHPTMYSIVLMTNCM